MAITWVQAKRAMYSNPCIKKERLCKARAKVEHAMDNEHHHSNANASVVINQLQSNKIITRQTLHIPIKVVDLLESILELKML